MPARTDTGVRVLPGGAVAPSADFVAAEAQPLLLTLGLYALAFVPFDPRALDAVWIAGAAVLVSFLATLYPAGRATKIQPAEVLRYE